MISNRLMKVLEFIMYGVVLNILWVMGTIIGLGILGFGPATISLGKTMQQKELFVSNGELRKIVKEFAKNYKRSFINSNIVFIVSLTSLVVLFFNFHIIQYNDLLYSIFYIPIVFLIIYIISATIIAIPITLFAKGSKKEKIRLILLSPVLNISATIFNLVFSVLIGMLILIAPIGTILIYGSMFVFGVIKININKLTKKKLLLEN